MTTHSAADQALLDLAHAAVAKGSALAGVSAADRRALTAAQGHLEDAGAGSRNPTHAAPQAALAAGKATLVATVDRLAKLGAADLAAKRGKPHQHLADLAHDCVGKVTDGATCKAEKVGARHSKATMEHLKKAHASLCDAGAKCDAAGRGTESDRGKAARPDDLAKLARERDRARSDSAALTAVLSRTSATLEKLVRRVEQPTIEEVANQITKLSLRDRELLAIKLAHGAPFTARNRR